MKEFALKTKIDVNSCDACRRIKPSAFFTLFQNAASLHADELGMGYDELIKKDVIWMLIRCRYDVLSQPNFEQEINVKTYPLPPRGIEFDREYLITDAAGNKLVKGTSKWCLCNYKTRKLILRGEYGYNIDEFTDEREYAGGLKKIADFPVDDFKTFTQTAYFTDLDHNGHVNNTRYLDFVLNAVAGELGDGKITSFEIDYVSELKAGETVTIYYKKTEEGFLVKCLCEGREIFRAIIGVSRERFEPLSAKG